MGNKLRNFQWDFNTEQEVKTFLKDLIDKATLHPRSVRFEYSHLEPQNNLAEFSLIGSGTIDITVKGGNLSKARKLFSELGAKNNESVHC